ncbi:MAG: radical SAM protein [Butyrivibrio sp.]|nr:radical SAM protein [Butyrivibrio sp.]MBR1641839.1 radical SAM protein [Butyrivibrio sp.]
MSETTYKWSRFNHIVTKDKERVLVYNTYSLYYRWIYNDDFEYLTTHTELNFENLDDMLIKEGYVVESDIDEIERLKAEAREYSNNDYLYLVIYTTMACNYRCSYCFEGDRLCNEHLTTEKADEIISFAKRYCEQAGLNKIAIKWFGGEPLLNQEPIVYITDKLNELGYTVRARIYTNGRLLTKEVATKLKELRVDNILIPIDGLEKDYVRLKNCSKEDYYTVLKNIKECEDIVNITLLLNVTDTNKSGIQKLIKLLHSKYGIKSKYRLNRIKHSNTSISNSDYYELCKKTSLLDEVIPRQKIGCEAQYRNYVVINTKGDIFKCEHIINIEKYKVGNIKDVDIEQLMTNNTEWNTDRVIDECKDCKLLPLCMNHCHTNNNIHKHECNYKFLCKMIHDRTTK